MLGREMRIGAFQLELDADTKLIYSSF